MNGPTHYQNRSTGDADSPVVDAQRDPIEVLAADFVDRFRRGERPTIEEYAEQNPDCAEEIRQLFPTIAAMEQLKIRKESQSGAQRSLGDIQLERLGDFRIIGEIGRGGMGIVYEAEQESLGRHVAVKVLPRQSLLEERRLKRFQREAKTAANLHHSNIVPILGVGEHDGYHYYVMQYIRGVGLDEVIAHLRQPNKVASRDSSSESSGLSRSAETASGRAVDISTVAEKLLVGRWTQPVKSSSMSRLSSLQSPIDREMQRDRSASAARASAGKLDQTTSRLLAAGEVQAEADIDNRSNSSASGAAPIVTPEATVGRFGASYWQSVARIGLQVAGALQYAHTQGTLHRDIKPANLLLDSNAVVWITDFGLAKAIENENLSRTGDIVGTLRYMAPEQVDGETTKRSDIFSLGLTLYELLTLQPAYDDAQRRRSLLRQDSLPDPVEPRKLNSDIPRDLETIVMKACAVEPDRRYRSAEELLEDLECFLDDRPIQARPVSAAERLWRWCRRNPAVAFWAGTAAALLLLVFGLLSFGFVQTRQAHAIVKAALDGETAQRKKAEDTLAISLDALDKVYQRFAPDRLGDAEELTVGADGEEEFDVPTQLAVSAETAAFLEDILVVYDRFAAQDSDNLSLRQEAAKANRRMGDIHRRLKQSQPAELAYLRAIHGYQEIVQKPDGTTRMSVLAELARAHNEMGILYRQSRNWNAARRSHLTSLETLTEQPFDELRYPDLTYELARTNYLLGQLSRYGGSRSSGSRNPAYLARAIELLTLSQGQVSREPDFRHLLALCYRDRSHDRDDGRIEDLNHAVNILEDLCSDFPAVPDYRNDLSEAYRRKGRFQRRSFRLSPEEIRLWDPEKIEDARLILVDARNQLQKSLEHSTIVISEHQRIYEYTRNHVFTLRELARIYNMLTVVHRLTGDVDDQMETFQRAESHYLETSRLAAILADDFANPFFRLYQLETRQHLTAMRYDQGRLESADVVLQEIIEEVESVMQSEGISRDGGSRGRFAREVIRDCYQELARVYSDKQWEEQAEAARQKARRRSSRSSDSRRRPPLENTPQQQNASTTP